MDVLSPASEPGIPGNLEDFPRFDPLASDAPAPDKDDGEDWEDDGWDEADGDPEEDDGDDWDDEDWDDEDEDDGEEGDWDDDSGEFDEDEDDEEWDDEPRLESRFLGLAGEDREERIRRRTLPVVPPRRSDKNHPPRGGVRRDANPSRDDEPPD